MNPGLFVVHLCFVIAAGVIAFWRYPQDDRQNRKRQLWLYAAAIAALFPVILKAIFVLFPWIEIRLMPIHLYAGIDREFMFPFQVLFLAIASRLIQKRNRKAMRMLVCMVAIYVIHQTAWHLTEPASYRSQQAAVDGVCMQTTGYTCGASSLVMLLDAYGIEATEGEMARLSRTIPERGVSDIQAADGLQKKLQLENRNEKVVLAIPGTKHLDDLTPPFVASTKYSFWFGHMICVLDYDDDVVSVADPLKGTSDWPRDEFEEKWYGTAIYINR